MATVESHYRDFHEAVVSALLELYEKRGSKKKALEHFGMHVGFFTDLRTGRTKHLDLPKLVALVAYRGQDPGAFIFEATRQQRTRLVEGPSPELEPEAPGVEDDDLGRLAEDHPLRPMLRVAEERLEDYLDGEGQRQ